MDSKKQSQFSLGFLALGIVYGDIGTSPLYTMEAVFSETTGVQLTPENILGTVSAIFWSLILVVSVKYVMLILRVNNRGEGGVLALSTLVLSLLKKETLAFSACFILGIIGATLFLADSVITPAISVLAALEGLNKAEVFEGQHFNVVGLAILILLALFTMQRLGTAHVGKYFSYVMCLWFITLGTFGFINIAENFEIIKAVNPMMAIRFFMDQGKMIFLALGGIVLAITGVEALYADMGHLGRKPIGFAWLSFVFPALALNYMGQGALLLTEPDTAIVSPFYNLFPSQYVFIAVIIATMATIIASQATITGTFSIVRQAIQLGMLPRLHIIHKSSNVIGQIYIPFVNWLLFSMVIMAVVIFRSSQNLAGAYGIAVTITMVISSLLMFQVVTKQWQVNKWLVIGGLCFFLTIDISYASANLLKLFHGGWFPIMIAILGTTLVLTWRQGRSIMQRVMRSEAFYLESYIDNLFKRKKLPHTVNRTAIFMVENPESVPSAFLDNIKHNMVLHERNIFLTVEFTTDATVPLNQRLDVRKIRNGFWRARVRYGFMENPDIIPVLQLFKVKNIPLDLDNTSFFISQQAVISSDAYGMAHWREEIFSWMHKNSSSVFQYFNIPASKVVILGSRVVI